MYNKKSVVRREQTVVYFKVQWAKESVGTFFAYTKIF